MVKSLVEYEFQGERWRIERFDLMSAELNLAATDLPAFHSAIAGSDLHRSWQFARRLWGISPIFPQPDSDPDDLRQWSWTEICEGMRVSGAQLKAELGALRAYWIRCQPSPPPPPEKPPATDELAFPDDEVLHQFGFPDAMFRQPGRADADNRAEKAHFAAKVKLWRKMLEHPVAGELARQTLRNELLLARGDTDLLSRSQSTAAERQEYQRIMGAQQKLQEIYRQQLLDLDKVFPWIGTIAGQVTVHGTLSDWVRGYQEYMQKGEHALFDGMFTAYEVQCELRQSVQFPDPRYRAGLVAYVNSARAGLWDPNWRPCFTPSQLRKLDEGFKEAARRAAEAEGETPIDLTSDDPIKGEYPALHLAGV